MQLGNRHTNHRKIHGRILCKHLKERIDYYGKRFIVVNLNLLLIYDTYIYLKELPETFSEKLSMKALLVHIQFIVMYTAGCYTNDNILLVT